MNDGHWIFHASDVMVPLVGLAGLALSLLFSWLAPWSTRRKV
jgi:hypothetical protein